jgi:hypothetical protein
MENTNETIVAENEFGRITTSGETITIESFIKGKTDLEESRLIPIKSKSL